MSEAEPPLGMIAGAGLLPRLVAEGARAAGRRVVIVGLRGWADPGLAEVCEALYWRGVVRMGGWVRALREAGCSEAVMVGRVAKADMFGMPRWKQWLLYLPDLTSIRVWYSVRDRRNEALLRAVADEMERQGVPLIDSTRYAADALAEEGTLTPFAPPARVLADVEFAWPVLKQVAALDIGQSLAVKEREIIAVEAIEGTDGLIKRAGELCPQGGWTLIKAGKPGQDMRFDVPTVGPETIENLHAAGAAALVIEAGKTFVLERERLLELAARHRIAIVGMRGELPGLDPS